MNLLLSALSKENIENSCITVLLRSMRHAILEVDMRVQLIVDRVSFMAVIYWLDFLKSKSSYIQFTSLSSLNYDLLHDTKTLQRKL